MTPTKIDGTDGLLRPRLDLAKALAAGLAVGTRPVRAPAGSEPDAVCPVKNHVRCARDAVVIHDERIGMRVAPLLELIITVRESDSHEPDPRGTRAPLGRTSLHTFAEYLAVLCIEALG
jgi:hypothetical protein